MIIESMLRRQAGLISRRQALAAGLSVQRINRNLAAGRWLLVLPRVYLASDREYTAEARVRAAGLWAEPASISGLAAAWWHGLVAEPPSNVDVTVPVRRCPRARQGIRVRRRDLAAADRVVIRGGLEVTAVPLTVLEAAVDLGERGSQLVDSALQRRVGLDTLRRAQFRNTGRRGSAAGSVLLAVAADQAASAAERKLIALLRTARIPGWVVHYRVDGSELDLAFPESGLAIEVDGWAWHQHERAFRRDRQRQNRLVLAGWTMLRFTWHDLVARPSAVIDEIKSALDRRN